MAGKRATQAPTGRASGVWPGRRRAGAADETLLTIRRSHFPGRMKPARNQDPLSTSPDQTTGFDHVGHHHQLVLPPCLQALCRRRTATADAVDLKIGTGVRGPSEGRAELRRTVTRQGPSIADWTVQPARGGKRANQTAAYPREPAATIPQQWDRRFGGLSAPELLRSSG